MPLEIYKKRSGLLLLASMAVVLTACNTLDRLNEVGSAPKLSEIRDPSGLAGVEPVSMPMPLANLSERQPNSLWKTGSRAFFRDQRATRIGDILTVVISIDEKAQLQNETKRTRENSEKDAMPNMFGYETDLSKVLPDTIDPTSLVKTSSSLSNNGKGSVNRSEKIDLRVAATIIQVLPNGNLVLAGKQQMTVNFDLRELQISGVIRPEDISSDNTVTYDQIAEARISYGGRGSIQDVQQPRYGSQILDIIMPF
ncbi:MAG: flagellar basal body L-ring protein FlgH [Alphaproteobacteria bacterium]|nr:flagellar basal body L-ring protein FlgH [Alphaproteobacteria bacterium]